MLKRDLDLSIFSINMCFTLEATNPPLCVNLLHLWMKQCLSSTRFLPLIRGQDAAAAAALARCSVLLPDLPRPWVTRAKFKCAHCKHSACVLLRFHMRKRSARDKCSTKIVHANKSTAEVGSASSAAFRARRIWGSGVTERETEIAAMQVMQVRTVTFDAGAQSERLSCVL